MGSLKEFDGKTDRITAATGETLPQEEAPFAGFDDLIGELLKGQYLVADIFPAQVPAASGGRYFRAENYFLQPERLRTLRLRFAGILLRLGCYYEMAVSFDDCVHWERDPEPEVFAAALADIMPNAFFRAVFPEQKMMIDYDPGDTYLTIYGTDAAMLSMLRALAAGEGLFLWAPPKDE